MGERSVAYRALVGKLEGRRPLGRSRRRWEDNIKMDLREVGWGAWTLFSSSINRQIIIISTSRLHICSNLEH
jgi:hypothetical protein